MDVVPWATALPVISALGVAALAGWFKVHSDRIQAEKDREIARLKNESEERKAEREAQVTAQAKATADFATVEVNRSTEETKREIAADTIDLSRGDRALDRIRELERERDDLIRALGRRDAAVTHWKDVTLELAHAYRLLEDSFNLDRSARVDELLLGADHDDWANEVVADEPRGPHQPSPPVVPVVTAPVVVAPPGASTEGPVIQTVPAGKPPATH